MNSFKSAGWEILSDQGSESYKITKKTRIAVVDYFRNINKPKNISPEERMLKSSSGFKDLKQVLEVVAGITFVFIFATGGVGIIIAPIIIIGIILVLLFCPNYYITPVSYRILMRRKTSQ